MSQGFVTALTTKTGQGRKGPWTRWSFKVDEGQWVTYGFSAPPFKQGDFIEYATHVNDRGYTDLVEGSVKVLPPRPQPGAQPGKVVLTECEPPAVVSVAGADRQQQIVMQHSQEMAIVHVNNLLERGALPLSSASSKAGEAKRNAEYDAAVDKYTVKFYNDVVTGRLLSTVADIGVVSIKADGPIPDAEPAAAAGERKW